MVARRANVRAFESGMEKIARMLSEKWGVKVIFRANECKTDGKTVWLPVIPDDASGEFLAAIQGFLDHEVGHIVYSQFTTLKKIGGRKKLFLLTDAIEDVRVEENMGAWWRGCQVNIDKCNEWAHAKVQARWAELSEFGQWVLGINVYLKNRAQPERGASMQQEEDWLIQNSPACWDRVLKVKDLLDRFPREFDFSSAYEKKATDRVLELAKEILDEAEEEEEPPEKFACPACGSEDLKQLSRSRDSVIYKCNDCGEEIELLLEDGEGPPGEGTITLPPGEDTEGDSEDTEGDSEDTEDGDSGKPDWLDVDDDELADDQKVIDRHEMIKNQAQTELEDSDTYLVYTTDGDVIERIQDGDRARYHQWMTEVRRIVGPITRRLKMTLMATNQTRWDRGKTRGALNGRAIHRIGLAEAGVIQNPRCFQRKADQIDFNTAVSMTIDHSGSMSGQSLKLAGQTAIILGEVLDSLGIPFEVLGHSTVDFRAGDRRFRSADYTDQELYARWGDLWVGVYKSFDENWSTARSRLIRTAENCKCNSFDAEVTRLALRRNILAGNYDRRILFELKDGQPCPNTYSRNGHLHRSFLRSTVKEAMESGFEVIGVGMMTDAVKQYYPNYVVVNDMESLAQTCMNELARLLMKGYRRAA